MWLRQPGRPDPQPPTPTAKSKPGISFLDAGLHRTLVATARPRAAFEGSGTRQRGNAREGDRNCAGRKRRGEQRATQQGYGVQMDSSFGFPCTVRAEVQENASGILKIFPRSEIRETVCRRLASRTTLSRVSPVGRRGIGEHRHPSSFHRQRRRCSKDSRRSRRATTRPGSVPRQPGHAPRPGV